MKGVAGTTIILVILAIVAVALVGSNYYKPAETPTRTTQTTSASRECQSKLSSYCELWNTNGYGRDAVSVGGRPGPWDTFASGCSRLGVSPTVDLCNRALGASAVTGRAVKPSISESSRLGFLESCNPNRDACDSGLVCKLGRDNVYRCLRAS